MSQAMNQRAFVRMPLENLAASITRENKNTQAGICLNLSGMGMLISTAESLEIGEKLSVSIKTAKNELDVVAVVMREQDSANDNDYAYGLKIESIN